MFESDENSKENVMYATKFLVTSLEWDSQKVAQLILNMNENDNIEIPNFLFFLSMRIKEVVEQLEKLKIINKDVVPALCESYTTMDFNKEESV